MISFAYINRNSVYRIVLILHISYYYYKSDTGYFYSILI